MGLRYLLDTNVVIDFFGHDLPVKAYNTIAKIIDRESILSIINKIELLGVEKVEQDLIDFVSFSTILPMDDTVANKTIEIRSSRKIKLPDAIIAATAIVHDLTLLSHNVKDFQSIPELSFQDSYQIEKC